MSSPARRILAAHKPKKSSPLSQSQSQQQLPAFGGGPVEDGKNSPSASGQKPASAAGPSPSKKPSLLSSALEGAKNGLSGFDQKPASPASPSDSKKSVSNSKIPPFSCPLWFLEEATATTTRVHAFTLSRWLSVGSQQHTDSIP